MNLTLPKNCILQTLTNFLWVTTLQFGQEPKYTYLHVFEEKQKQIESSS